MDTINVQIDISSAVGRKLVREIQKHPKIAKIETSIPESITGRKVYTIDESFNRCCDILSENYGVDVRKL